MFKEVLYLHSHQNKVMEKKLRIRSTFQPKERPDYTAWCKALGVSSRVPKETQSFAHLNAEYDFNKLNRKRPKIKLA